MPCMGPTPPSDELVEEVTNDLFHYLTKKYEVLDYEGMEQEGFMRWFYELNQRHRLKAFEVLRTAVYEILWQDACEKF